MALEALAQVLSSIGDRIHARTDHDLRRQEQLDDEQRREAMQIRAEDRGEERTKRMKRFDLELTLEQFKKLSRAKQLELAEEAGIENAETMSPAELHTRLKDKEREDKSADLKAEANARYQAHRDIEHQEATRTPDPKEIAGAKAKQFAQNAGAYTAAYNRYQQLNQARQQLQENNPEIASLIAANDLTPAATAALNARMSEIEKIKDQKQRARAYLVEATQANPQAVMSLPKADSNPVEAIQAAKAVLTGNPVMWAKASHVIDKEEQRANNAIMMVQLRMTSSEDRAALATIMKEQSDLGNFLIKGGVDPTKALVDQVPSQARDFFSGQIDAPTPLYAPAPAKGTNPTLGGAPATGGVNTPLPGQRMGGASGNWDNPQPVEQPDNKVWPGVTGVMRGIGNYFSDAPGALAYAGDYAGRMIAAGAKGFWTGDASMPPSQMQRDMDQYYEQKRTAPPQAAFPTPALPPMTPGALFIQQSQNPSNFYGGASARY